MIGGHSHGRRKQGRGNPPETNYLPRTVKRVTADGVHYTNEWWQWRATQVPPWTRRARGRRRAKVARASRKANR